MREVFQRIFALGNFWGWVSRYAATPSIVALFPCHSDTTSQVSSMAPIATGNHLARNEKIPKVD